MKISLIADIHGNLSALQAVLRHARTREAENTILNLGDSIGYGPHPNQVVQWIQGSNIYNILGNYDKKVLSKKHQENRWEKVRTAEKRTMFAWTCQALSDSSRHFLENIPETRALEFEGRKILMTHGSPASNSEHLRIDTPRKRFIELAKLTEADIVLCGHSHQAFVREVDGVLFINPGSVGRPDDGDPRASYAILEVKQGKIDVQHFRVPYNIMETVGDLRRTGLRGIFQEIIRQGMNYDAIVEKFGENPDPAYLEPSGIVTLTTDFGLQDHFVGVMKGVIADIAPQAQVIDISHNIQPQDVHAGARMLAEAAPYFTPGTVHVAVVDPGVGTARHALAARIGAHFYVAPDNGLLTLLLQKAADKKQPVEIIDLNQPQYWLPETSHSFHGRDIFAPVGAHLANGLPIEKLGEGIKDPILLHLSLPKRTSKGWQAEVVWVDSFGNLSTNLPQSVLPKNDNITVKCLGRSIPGMNQAFGDATEGNLIAFIDSTGHLALAVVNGSAKERLRADVGTEVEVIVGE